MYTLEDVPGKGKGLVARKLIPKGTRILEERPIVKTPKRKKSDEWLNANVAQQVDSLDDSRKVRRQTLQEKFGFLCSCHLCSLDSAESQKSDQRLARIDQLDDLIGAKCISGNFSQQALRYVDERVRLYDQQGQSNSSLPRAYLDAAQIAIANGDLARGSVFARRAVEGWRTAQGSDSDEVVEYAPLIQDPAKLPLYGISMRWKTSLEEVPSELDSNDFEDWLWKREQPKKTHQSGQLTSLRCRDVFPGFAALPYSLDSPGFHRGSQEIYQSSRHWCFLGEITDSITLHHLELELTDADDKKIPLHFNTDGRGSEFSIAQLRKGYTVAILYAERHTFIHGDPGIKLIDPKMLKIFPVSLNKLLDLSDRIQQFSGDACQRTGWVEKGHKTDCKMLKDSDLRGLFTLEWDKLDTRTHFPLDVTTTA
ncbi:hypothetical protein C7974DRAFT_322137 [Boeremia exigua]|uniref:uncharacterized protein n=1 Tax=Boeremia exigua TaxID=749465 RepID=UPI001E8E4053|nr:uncharacterized protein C7974DRAFT_322137 [Boeremia exigua]KAH6613217.1 hypothetical protein C7974DRAFT_322137 [Boeremia exigua]